MHKLNLDDYQQRTLPALLQRQATENGAQKFLIDDEHSITFEAAYEQSKLIAAGLKNLGVGKGGNVALLLKNCPEMVLIALATNMLGAVWVPINTDYKGQWLRDTLNDSEPMVLVTQSSFIEQHHDEINSAEIAQTIVLDQGGLETLTAHAQALEIYPTADYGDTSAIMWTSGTTGKSKGVMLSHNNWLRPIVEGTCVFYQSQPGDIILNVLPMYHAAAWNTAILRALVEGIPAVIEKRFSVSNFWQRVNKFGATQTFTLGAMHMFLWNAPVDAEQDKNTLRRMQAVPMPGNIRSSFEQRFDLKLLGSGFGQSECMMIITEAGFEGAPENSMGFAARDLEVKLFDDNDQEVALGEVGEIRVRPKEPHTICNGYFKNPQASKEAWKGKWFCTGDMARQVEGGAYYFSDRKKDAVRYAGRNISTLEVESIVRQHPQISDVAAYGITSQEIAEEDELAITVVAADKELDAESLARFINENAPYYFVPRYITFKSELPYTPTNKVQKFKLREAGVQADTWDRIEQGFKIER